MADNPYKVAWDGLHKALEQHLAKLQDGTPVAVAVLSILFTMDALKPPDEPKE